MLYLLLFISTALLVIALTTLLNCFTFPRLHKQKPQTQPLVAILVPARNEAQVIGQTVQSLLRQNYANFKLFILDDHSDDGTGQLALEAGAGDERLRILSGNPLLSGWLGKNWACHQMVQYILQEQAQANQVDWLLFTDADVQWGEGALAALVAQALQTKADLLTAWPTQITLTWTERLVVPLMAFVVLGYLPLIGVHHTPFAAFAAANGQCMLWRRRAYQQVGGHKAVKDNVLEDVNLARLCKQAGLRLRLVDGAGQISCRMYQNWGEVKNGYAKNILAGYGNQPLFLILGALFHWLLFVCPWLWLALGWLDSWQTVLPGWPLWPLILSLLGLTIRALTAHFTQQGLLDALFLPISVLLMTLIAAQSLWWCWRYGGPQWKGRVI